MSLRRGLLIAMLVALALCAGMGVLVVFAGSNEAVIRMLGTAIDTAVAAAIMVGLSFLISREKLRLGGLAAMGVIFFCWLIILGMIWLSGSSAWDLDEALLQTFSFTLLMGLPSAIVLLFVSFKWARFSIRAFIGGATLAYAICELGAGIMFMRLWSYPELDEPFITGMLLYAMTVIVAALLLNAGCGDRRHFRWPGVALAIVAWAISVMMVWSPVLHPGPWPVILMGSSWIVAGTLAHTNLVLMARLRRWQVWVQWTTMALAWLCAIEGIAAIVIGVDLLGSLGISPEDLFPLHAVAGTGIMAACGSLALIVLSVFNLVLKSQRAETGARVAGAMQASAMEVVCPRCHERQMLVFGDSTCKSCELQFFIKVTEPRCPACGYLLYRLTSPRCPECGADLGTPVPGAQAGPAFPVAAESAAAPDKA